MLNQTYAHPYVHTGSYRASQLPLQVFIDYENIAIGLEKRSGQPNPALIVTTIRRALADYGKPSVMAAYNDWEDFGERTGIRSTQVLFKMGVECPNHPTVKGKNSMDMYISADLQRLMQACLRNPGLVNTVAIVSGDRDFRAAIEEIRRQGKRVILLAWRGDLASEMVQVADEVRWLNDYMPDSPAISAANPLAGLALRTAIIFNQTGEETCQAGVLIKHLGGRAKLTQAIAAGVLLRGERSSADPGDADVLQFNFDHPLVRAAVYLADWLPQKIDWVLNVRKLPYVGTKYLVQGMCLDQKLQQIRVGQTEDEAIGWLNLAEGVGLVTSRTIYTRDGHRARSWGLPAE